VDVFSGTCFVAVGLLVASVPVVRVVRVFAMGHEEMKVASGETHRAKRHDADSFDCCVSISRCPEDHDRGSRTISEFLNLARSKRSVTGAEMALGARQRAGEGQKRSLGT
jgi:hypothetical protein